MENGEAFSTRNEQATRLVEKTCGRFPLYDCVGTDHRRSATREHGNDQRRVENGEAFSTRIEQATRLVEKTCGRFPPYDRAKE
ncbi:hypothetical protein [Stutzerimonas nitrititolerans]|uniref:hypothetical protein n=1 Tax=Stutzerimonas nitrititolerans TaxID=2482751 RepID=UPI00148263FA|nr:hypothetical protein [Stutzerimonas nitrititolerans]NNT92378.1 hypothetical protein [Stutzerimonas nitrititolerans]